MAQTFTARSIGSLPVPSEAQRQRDYWDGGCKGLGLRVSFGGTRTWVLRYRANGRRRRLTLGTFPSMPLAKARERANEESLKVACGEDPAAAKVAARTAESDTFGALASLYLEQHAKRRKKSWREDARYLDVELLPKWRYVKVGDIRRRDVHKVVQAIADRGAPIAANRVLSLVSTVFAFALDREWIDSHPATHMKKPAPEHSRERVLSDDEIRELWKAIDTAAPARTADGKRITRLSPALCDGLKLRLILAQRGAETLAMRWADVDLTAAWWSIPGAFTKNGQPHRVPLPAMALAILQGRRASAAADAVWVFERDGKQIGQAWKRAASDLVDGQRRRTRKEGASLRLAPAVAFDFTAHDLRRTAASNMAALGVPRHHISAVLNHQQNGPAATRVYDRHSYDAEKRMALDVWTRRLDAIVNAATSATVLPFAQAR